RYNLFINCGGSDIKIGNTTYSGDTAQATPSSFSQGDNWAYSSTGHFLDDENEKDAYIVDGNLSGPPTENGQLYMNARLSPISLTYYGFCLKRGPYTVSLRFAEIMFTGDKNYSRLGRRAFNIYIQ
ncbi:hypothetical protein NL676_023981, partial [Syzygium grande]